MLRGKYPNSFWGPGTWRLIHSMAINYEPNPVKKKAFLQFIYSLPELLPCEKCRIHLRNNLRKNPPERHMASKEKLFLWTYRLHDVVNRQKDYPTVSPPYDLVRKYYMEKVASCNSCSA